MHMEDNHDMAHLLKRILAEKGYYVKQNELVKQLNTHPFYPSLESILDTLNHYSLGLKAYQIDPNDISEATQAGCIAHLKREGDGILYISHVKDGQALTWDLKGEKKQVSLSNLSQVISGVVIPLVDSPIQSKLMYNQAWVKENRLPIIGAFFFLVGFFGLSTSFAQVERIDYWVILLGLNLVGLGISWMIKVTEKNSTTNFKNVCSFSPRFNCHGVLNHPSSIVLSPIKWSDLGLIFYLGNISLLLMGVDGFWLYLMISLSALYIPYSLYVQKFVIKKWCTFCLLIQLVNSLMFTVIIVIHPNAKFDLGELVVVLTSYSFLSLGVIYFTRFENSDQKLLNREIDLYSFRRNPLVFSTLLSSSQRLLSDQNIDKLLSLKTKTSSTKSTMLVFLSLHCRYCKEVFIELLKREASSSNLNVHFCLIMTEADAPQLNLLEEIGKCLDSNDVEKAHDTLKEWYESASNRSPLQVDINKINTSFAKLNSDLFERNKIIQTPSMYINGSLVPNLYKKLDDIIFHANL